MDTSLKYLRIVLVVLLSGAAAITGWSFLARADDMEVENLTAQSQPEIQQLIYDTLNAAEQGDKNNSAEFFGRLASLRKVDQAEIVKQLAIFAARVGDGEEVLKARRILDLLNIRQATIIQVLAPYLNADNPNLKSFVRDWFQNHDKAGAPGPGRAPLQPVNYNDYKDYVRGKVSRNEEIPEAFIDYVYERLPSHALLIFYQARGQKDRDVLLAERVIQNAIWLKENGFNEEFQKELPTAKGEILKLAQHKEWWVRLYVAETMRRYAELREPTIFKQLANDSNDLVANAAKKDVKPEKQIDTAKRAKAYEKLQKMIDARKAAAPTE